MDYRKIGQTYYIRFDKGDEMVSGIRDICIREHIDAAIYTGIGGCSHAEIQTFSPAKGAFESELIEGMLELISFTGNIVSNQNGDIAQHTHALYTYTKDGTHYFAGGHLKTSTVLYTAEIELRPVIGGTIRHKPSTETGTAFWDFE